MSAPDASSLNEVVHNKTRLSVLAVLSNTSEMEFVSLRNQLGVSDGALSLAIRKLEENGMVKTNKSHAFGRSKTTIDLTSKGLEELQKYLAGIRAIIDAVPNMSKQV